MKKLLSVAVAALSLAGALFAVDFSIDGNFSVPLNFSSESINVDVNANNYTHTKTKYTEIGFGADVGLKAMFTKKIGAKVDLGFYFPNTQNSETTTVSALFGTVTSTGPTKGSVSLSNISDFTIFAGPAIVVDSSKKGSICVTPGVSFDFRTTTTGSGDSAVKNTVTYVGVGAEVDAKYNLSKKVYLNAACPVIYKFNAIDSNNNERSIQGLFVAPKVGIGVNL